MSDTLGLKKMTGFKIISQSAVEDNSKSHGLLLYSELQYELCPAHSTF